MAAAFTLDRITVDSYTPFRSARPSHPAGTYRHAVPRRARRPRPAVLRRRRFLAAFIGLVLALTVARAGAALEGSHLAAPERLPHVQTVVVQPGDTLWSLAHRLAPNRDPRAVVDALVEARGTSVVQPGDTVTWLAS
jgi:uncharacterized protein (DUF1684 family)